MPRGHYGRAAKALAHATAQAPIAAAPRAVAVGAESFISADSGGGVGGGWKIAAAAAAAITGIVVLGAATTSFSGGRRRRTVSSPFRQMR